jgi:hypothetical protein
MWTMLNIFVHFCCVGWSWWAGFTRLHWTTRPEGFKWCTRLSWETGRERFKGKIVFRWRFHWENVFSNHCLSRCDGLETKQKCLLYVFVWVYVHLCTVTDSDWVHCIFVYWSNRPIEGWLSWNVQPRWIIFNEVETKDLCTVRYSSTSNRGLLFRGFEVCRDSGLSYLYRHAPINVRLTKRTSRT